MYINVRCAQRQIEESRTKILIPFLVLTKICPPPIPSPSPLHLYLSRSSGGVKLSKSVLIIRTGTRLPAPRCVCVFLSVLSQMLKGLSLSSCLPVSLHRVPHTQPPPLPHTSMHIEDCPTCGGFVYPKWAPFCPSGSSLGVRGVIPCQHQPPCSWGFRKWPPIVLPLLCFRYFSQYLFGRFFPAGWRPNDCSFLRVWACVCRSWCESCGHSCDTTQIKD